MMINCKPLLDNLNMCTELVNDNVAADNIWLNQFVNLVCYSLVDETVTCYFSLLTDTQLLFMSETSYAWL